MLAARPTAVLAARASAHFARHCTSVVFSVSHGGGARECLKKAFGDPRPFCGEVIDSMGSNGCENGLAPLVFVGMLLILLGRLGC